MKQAVGDTAVGVVQSLHNFYRKFRLHVKHFRYDIIAEWRRKNRQPYR